MSQTVFLNGQFQDAETASVSIFDRGFLFGDGVYEVIPVYDGSPFYLAAHLKRLNASLAAINLENPLDELVWVKTISEIISRNGGGDLSLYIQVSRGVAKPRDHAFPKQVMPTVLITATPLKPISKAVQEHGVSAVLLEDFRWHRCDIKSTALLGNVLLRQQAVDAGAYEAILQRDGYVTEGAASNLFVVQSGEVLTPPTSEWILAGVTRRVILKLLEDNNIPLRQTAISTDLLKRADEVWLTSSTKGALPVTILDDKPVGSGGPGKFWKQIFDLYQTAIS